MRFPSRIIGLAATLFLIPMLVGPSVAQWPADGRALCTAANAQYNPTIVTDGAGGAIVTWEDTRSGTGDIYAQHVLASGAVDPAWPADGLALCTAANDQLGPTIVADGSGGAIVTWYDYRSGTNPDIYAHRVLASGAVDPAWPADGRALCTAASDQGFPTIATDGVGGAIVTWQDLRNGSTNPDIYAQRVLASGGVDPAWPADGRAVCAAANSQLLPRIVADGAGGAIVTWNDRRLSNSLPNTYDIYAQHVLASGAVDVAWPADGRALCTSAGNQTSPTIAGDGTGGAVVTWQDFRVSPRDIYAHHVLTSGAVDPAWPADGGALCTDANNQQLPEIVADGAGGAIVAWEDSRSGSNDLYAQHVLASGAVDPAWPADGRALCTAANDQYNHTIVADGAGGAIVTWEDARSGTGDIYAQRVLASGAVDPAWPADGRALCTAASDQGFPTIVADGSGGAIVAWRDNRDGNYDIYAQRVLASGEVTGVPVGGAPAEIALRRPHPNPASRTVTLGFALPREARMTLAIYDVGGRRVTMLIAGTRPAGEQSIEWDLRDDEGRAVRGGLYFARLEVAGRTNVRRIATLQ